MRARLITCVLLSAGWTQAVSLAVAQEPAPPAGTPVEAAPAPAPAGVPEVVSEQPAVDPAPVESPPPELPPEPVAAEAAPVEESVELTDAELAAMGLSSDVLSGAAPVVDTSLKLSGFADIGFISAPLGKNSPWGGVGSVSRHSAFYVGNLNLYIGKNLTDSVRMFGEVRFLFLPNGMPDGSTGRYVDTSANDYTDFGRPVQWGGITIPRLYLEWTAHRALQFRAGQFLTPYGIWNVDHGSPTIVPVQKPYIIGSQLFPERQTGIEALGQFDASAHNSLGYHLTISNGTGPAVAYRDFDQNKAFGWRAWWRYDGLGELRLGTSGYYGRHTAVTNTPGLAMDGIHVAYTEKILTSYDALALAGDLKWTYKGLLVQSEAITKQRRYRDDGRVGANNALIGRYLAGIDKLSYGVYGLIGYRFDWYGVMPFLVVQYVVDTDANTSSVNNTTGFSAGLNVRPIDSLVFKVEYDEGRFPKGSVVSNDPIRLIQVQIAWAF